MPDDPPGSYAGRLNAKVVAGAAFPPQANPAIFACGPSGFVEAASALLVAAGHPPGAIKTERFGPTASRGASQLAGHLRGPSPVGCASPKPSASSARPRVSTPPL